MNNPPKAVLFDAYGTLFDVYSVGVLAEQLFPGHGAAIGQVWRDKQIEYTRLVTTSNHGEHYRPFWELTRAGLLFAIKKIAKEGLSTLAPAQLEEKVEALMAQYLKLTAFPENHEVLQALKARGIPTGVLSNGNMDMLQAVVDSAQLGPLLDHVISIDGIRKYKTHPDAYALGPLATGVPASETLFVSCNAWDALAATWYGYQTLWVNRAGGAFEELGTRPTREGSSLRDVMHFFS